MNSLAITGFVLGLLSAVCCQPLGPVGIFVSIRALRKIREGGEEGMVFALIGLVASILGTLLLVVFVFFLIVSATVSTTSSPRSTLSPFRTSTTVSTSTTMRGAPGTRSGSSLPPSTCAGMQSAMAELDDPGDSTSIRLATSANTLMDALGPSWRDDVTTVLLDGLSRAGRPGDPGTRPPAVDAAANDIRAAIDDRC
jgi:hypothetical protein